MNIGFINISGIKDDRLILKPNFHLNFGKKRISKMVQTKREFKSLGDITHDIYKGGFFKNIFVDKADNGIPYISGQHILNMDPIESSKLVSKKYTPLQQDMTLRVGQILLSCAGTVGNVRLIEQDLEGVIGSQDIIRIIPDDNKVRYGYLTAYLASPTAFSYIQSYIYGSVVPRVEPNTLSKLPVLILEKRQQDEIHKLIIDSSKLRSDAISSLKDLVKDIQELLINHLKINENINEHGSSISIKSIHKLEKRLDASYNAGLGRRIYDSITSSDYITINSISDVFHPMLFGKKQLKGSALRGNPLFKSSSMMKTKPETDFWLSKRKIEIYQKLQVKEGWILVSRTGTVGNIVRITKQFSGFFIDDHMIRIIPRNGYSGLIYTFLKTAIGQELISFQKYGSVQDVINRDYIERIPIPSFLFEPDLLKKINCIVNSVQEKIDTAFINEQSAIDIIENEIESWQN